MAITNTAPGLGTDIFVPGQTTTLPVWTSQIKCLPSTPHANSKTISSLRLIEQSGALVGMMGGGKWVPSVMGKRFWDLRILMIGIPSKRMRRYLTLMDVRGAAGPPPLLEKTVLPVNMKTSSTATPLDSASTGRMFVMDILIQAVVGMMKALIIVWRSTSKQGLSRDMPP